MTLQRELQPFEKDLTLWKERGALPQGDVKNALIDIYQKLHDVKPNIGARKVPSGCVSCVGEMMKALYNNLNEVPTIQLLTAHSFKEDSNVEEIKKNVSLNPAKEKTEANNLDYSAHTFQQLKKLCKQRGLKFKITDKKEELARLLMINQS